MQTSSRNAAAMLRKIEQVRLATARHSADNGVVLIVWGMTFLLDLVAFDLSRLTGSPLAAIIFVTGFNAAVLLWRWWYIRRQPIRLRRVITNRVIFVWSWYYVALIGLGIGGWAIVLGAFPPLWFTLLGALGALPLLVSGVRLWRRAHASGSRRHAAGARGTEGDDHGVALTR